MSKTSWIALLLVLLTSLSGCSSSDAYDPTEDEGYWDDDDADGYAWIDQFQPPVVTVGHTVHFMLVGDFCTGQEPVSFTDESTSESVTALHYTLQTDDRIEGTLPDTLWVGTYWVCIGCSFGWGDCIEGGLEVVPEGG